jgi:molybdate transport system substrate-binding protein
MNTVSRRTVLAMACLLATCGIPGLQPVAAQNTTFDCPTPAQAATLVAAEKTPSSPAVEPVAFPEAGGNLTVFAAASLTDAFEQMATDIAASHPEMVITYNFGGSQALVTQLAEGAEADIFASANNAQMQAATENGSIAGEPVTFTHNRLAIVVPAENPAGIATPADLGLPGLRLVLAQVEVPAGRYAREAVCAMGADADAYGNDFVARVAGNVVSEEEDVRDALAKVQLGEADAGIVYISDAGIAGDDVQIIEIPGSANIEVSYPIAAVTGGDPELAAFIAYVLSPAGQATLAAHGFS